MDDSTLLKLFIPTWILVMALAAGAIRIYDRLIRLEYETRREQWEKDGRPLGNFWAPPGTSTTDQVIDQWFSPSARFGRSGRLFAWLFKTPGWIDGYPEAMKLLRLMRVLEGAGLLLVAVWFLLFAIA